MNNDEKGFRDEGETGMLDDVEGMEINTTN